MLDKKELDEFSKLVEQYTHLQKLYNSLKKGEPVYIQVGNDNYLLDKKQIDKLKKHFSKEVNALRLYVKNYG